MSAIVQPMDAGKPLMHRLFPFIADLKAYRRADLKSDFFAALTIAAISLPQSMAYAVIAGVDPRYGIYASIFPVIVAALWGSSRFLISGPTNPISLVLFTAMAHASVGGVAIAHLPEEVRLGYYFGVTVLSGLLQVAMALGRLGDLVGFVSHSVMVGFTSGAAILIASGQLRNFFGQKIAGHSSFFPQVLESLRHIEAVHLPSAALATASVLMVLLLRRFQPKLPAYILTIFVMGLAAWLLDLERMGVAMLGEIPEGLPPLSSLPPFDLDVISGLFMPALAIAFLATVESLSVGKNLAGIKSDKFDPNQELMAQGLANIVSGFSSGIAGCGSLTRSAANALSGARTKFAAALCGFLCLIFFLTMAPLASRVPMPVLAGILMAVAIGMIDRENIRLCMVATRMDRYVFLSTLAATMVLDLEKAIFLGILLSLVLFLYRVAHPRVEQLDEESPLLAPYPWAANCPQLGVYVIEGTLFFGAINVLERQLEEHESNSCSVIVLHLARIFWIDASGANVLSQFAERCFARDTPIVFVLGNEAVSNTLFRTGLLNHLHGGYIAHSLHDGLHLAHNVLKYSRCKRCDKVAAACLLDDKV